MNFKSAARVSQVSPPAIARILEKQRRLEANGVQLTSLLRGEPDFDTPTYIVEAATRALRDGQTHYTPAHGIRALREAVSHRVARDFGFDPDPDEEIIITTGATLGIFTALQAVINPGDEVILFDPVYDPYPSVVRLAGGVPVRAQSAMRDGHFSVENQTITALLTERTKAILINNPWNPTGSVMTATELNELVELAEQHDLVLIADEIYEALTFDGHTHMNLASLSETARARTITVNSFSKTYAMTGWRIGYTVAPPSLTKAMRLIVQQCSRSAATFVQYAGVAALDGPQEPVQRMVAAYARRRALSTESLLAAGLDTFHPPEGTFFVFLDIRSHGKDSQTVADYLLKQARVVTVPGSVYGPGGEGFIRLSFAYDEETLQSGIDAIVTSLQHL